MVLAICDDDKVQIHYTQKLVEQHFSHAAPEIRCFSSANELINRVSAEHFSPDIAILDIDMEGMNGIDLAKNLNLLLPDCRIIFLTGYAEYCSEVYAADHVFFILKDHAAQYLDAALEKAVLSINSKKEQMLFITAGGTDHALALNEIFYIESCLRKVQIHTESGQYEVYAQLDHLLSEEQIKSFIRCHKSYLVNLKYITAVNSTHLILKGDIPIPISRPHLVEVRKAFFDYQMA